MTYERLYAKAGSYIIVNANTPLIIMIRDDHDFNRYINRGIANFYGGYFNSYPVFIEVPHNGYWNVSLDTCGLPAERLEYSVTLHQEQGNALSC